MASRWSTVSTRKPREPESIPEIVAHHFHGLGQVAFRSSVIALSDGHKDCIKDVELSDAGGGILAEEWGTAKVLFSWVNRKRLILKKICLAWIRTMTK